MKIKRMMAMIFGLAVLAWLAVPALRIWQNPGFLKHRHSFDGKKLNKRLAETAPNSNPSRPLRAFADVYSIEHQVPFWDVYRAMLLGYTPPIDDECPTAKGFESLLPPHGPPTDEPDPLETPADSALLKK